MKLPVRKLFAISGILIAISLLLAACGRAATETPTPAPTRPRDTPVPFIPDEALFKEYFSEFGIGRLEEGKKAPDGVMKDQNVFTREDDICFYATAIKQTKVAFEVFDVGLQSVVSPKTTYLTPFLPGYNANCIDYDIGSGNFEWRVYVQNTPIAKYDFTIQ